MQNRTNKTKDVLLELVAVAFLASAGIFVRGSSLSPVNTGLWRMIIAFPFLLSLGYKDIKNMKLPDIILSLLSGIFLAGDLVFFNNALVTTSMANTNLLTNMTAFIIVPVSYFLFKEKIPKFYFLGLIITLLGVVVLILGKAHPTASNYIGDICAVTACMFYSLYILLTYRLRDRISSSAILAIGAIGSIITLLCVAGLREGIQVPTNTKEWINMFLFAICMQVIGQNLLAHCQGKISVNLSIALTLLQPVFAAIYSLILFRESLSIIEIAGMVVVIIGVYICKRQYSN